MSLKEKFKPTRPLMCRNRISTRRPFFLSLPNSNQLSSPREKEKRNNERRNTDFADRNVKEDAHDENEELVSNEQNDVETESIDSGETQLTLKNKTLSFKKTGVNNTIENSSTPSLIDRKKPSARKLIEKFSSPSVQFESLSSVKAGSSAVNASSFLNEKNNEQDENSEFSKASFTRISDEAVNISRASTVDIRRKRSEPMLNLNKKQNTSLVDDFGNLKKKKKLNDIPSLKDSSCDTSISNETNEPKDTEMHLIPAKMNSITNKSMSINLSSVKAGSSAMNASTSLKEKNNKQDENFEFSETSFTRISGGEVNISRASTVEVRRKRSEPMLNLNKKQNTSLLNDFGNLKKKEKLNDIPSLKDSSCDTSISNEVNEPKDTEMHLIPAKMNSITNKSMSINLSSVKAGSSAMNASTSLKEKNNKQDENFEFSEASFTRISGGEVNVSHESTVGLRQSRSEPILNLSKIQNTSLLNDFGNLKKKNKLNLSGIFSLNDSSCDTSISNEANEPKDTEMHLIPAKITNSVPNKSSSHKPGTKRVLQEMQATVVAQEIRDITDAINTSRLRKKHAPKLKEKDVSKIKLSGQRTNEYLTPYEKSPPMDIDTALNELLKPLKRKHFPLSQESLKALERRKVPRILFEIDTDSDPKSFQLSQARPVKKTSKKDQVLESKKLLLRNGISLKRQPTNITDLEVGLSVVVTAFEEIRNEVHDNDMLNMLKEYEENVIKDISETISKVVQLQEKDKDRKKLNKEIAEKSRALVRIKNVKLKQRSEVEAV